MRPVEPEDVVRGQFRGYRSEKGVSPDSQVETFAALRLYIDDWRWGGVPFYILAGKCLPFTATEVFVQLKKPPQKVFDDGGTGRPNYFHFRLTPDVFISLGGRTKIPGEAMVGQPVELLACQDSGGETSPYARLLHDAIRGDPILFGRQDGVEAAWRVVDPILEAATPVYEYEPGTWGPPEADRIIDRAGWHRPGKVESPPRGLQESCSGLRP